MEQRLCKSQVISELIYGCECWTLKAETERKIFVSGKDICQEDYENLIQRPCYKYDDSLQAITVDAVLRETPFSTLCKRRKLQRLGHTTRHNTIANKTMQGD